MPGPTEPPDLRRAAAGGPSLPVNALRIGTRVNEFEITGIVGEGGFGIVYLAFDHSLHRVVALKEYMPSALAERVGGHTVAVRSERQQPTFDAGLRSFVNEARMLAQFDHPALVKVYRFWEGNGTAYMAMPYYEGRTLKQALRDNPDFATEAALKAIFGPVLDALELLHRNQCFHRDVSPDNVMILESGAPVLLDFGAARRIIGDLTQGITVILKPGYAPIEQYADDSDLRQGPWTDIYAVSAVLYAAIVGRPPPTSVARIVKDPLEPLQGRQLEGYDRSFLAAIDRGLGVRPEHRPQSIPEFRAALGLEVTTKIGGASSPGFVTGIAPRTGGAPSAATVLPTAPLPNAAMAADPPTRMPGPITADSHDSPTLAGGLPQPIHADRDVAPGALRRRGRLRLPLPVIGVAAAAVVLVAVILWRAGDADRAPVAAADTAKGTSGPSAAPAESAKSTGQPVSDVPAKAPGVALPDASSPPPLASPTPATPRSGSTPAPPVAAPPVTASPAPPVTGDDDLAWESIQRSCLEQGFIGFVFRFPDSPHVTEAKRRLVELQEKRPCSWGRGGSASERPAAPRAAAQKEKAAADRAEAAQREKAASERAAAAQKAEADRVAAAQREKAAADRAAAAQKAEAERIAAAKAEPPRRPSGPATRSETPAAPATAPPKEPPASVAMGGASAAVSLQVKPWGEVYVNGVLRGISPPLKVLELSEGRYAVEIRNPGFASYRRDLDIRRPERISLSHEFK